MTDLQERLACIAKRCSEKAMEVKEARETMRGTAPVMYTDTEILGMIRYLAEILGKHLETDEK